MSVIGEDVTDKYKLPQLKPGFYWEINHLFDVKDGDKHTTFEHTEILLYEDYSNEIIGEAKIDTRLYGRDNLTIGERAWFMAETYGALA